MEKKLNTQGKYAIYQHCLLSAMPPNYLWEEKTVKSIFLKSKALFCRYESEWDVQEKTEWWYCIKDTPYDIETVKSSIRYEIKKGRKNFYGKVINPTKYSEAIFEIDKKKFAEYPQAYRPQLPDTAKEHMKNYLQKYKAQEGDVTWSGIFSRENDEMAGFMICIKKYECVSLDVMGMNPQSLSKASSAALVDFVIQYYEQEFSGGGGSSTSATERVIYGTRPIFSLT